MKTKSLEDLQKELADFAKVRDWDKFHSPKNLSIALSVEASELIEIFQWLTEEESKNLNSKQLTEAEQEVADILLYLLQISEKLNINILDAAYKKLEANDKKYPIEACFGSAKKYTEL
ncbi:MULTISPECIES: nucleotide pyrophosphohydrolase [Klebsiella pneumoniae complex]|uniref:nucleotide pyrophosphohydrolase n=1 Tax=Klebsiella pneumoniae complex TaxID=3390273 RepID=UPI001033F540|nr:MULTISPECIES: nucleotide pyrophosphohydrolase [Klebsiella]HCB1413197.1 nucleotide pyrophosphohydrolase [Klebsiella variicola subsp. variicola]HCI6916776.1 nucleotide pyrophosphohydrolase [Klebsiella quasipneumoniae subsp. similipneumoniae]MBK5826656.1 nucleotide pyrophosphohydrolase [Klebsiella pneumoniae]QRR64282.1 nucleotide pyrophosphohydrolase [Klebsiella pneumoniae]HBT0293599.1 nucleotide pyrophosphohydrolase [Klebsiella pneumoniae]